MTKRSRASLERRMAANKKPHRFGEIVHAIPTKDGEPGLPDRVRYSRVAGLLAPDARAEFEAERAKAAHCPKHGALADPAIFIAGEGADRRVAFACPWCSGEAIREQWEREGMS